MTEPRCFRILYFRPVRYFWISGKERSHREQDMGNTAGAESLQPFPALKNRRLVARTAPLYYLLLTALPFGTAICIAGPWFVKIFCVHNLSDAHCAFDYKWHLHVFCSPYLIFVFSFGLIVVHPCLVASRQTSDYHSLFKYYICQNNCTDLFSSPEHKVLMVSYCDRPLSVVRCLTLQGSGVLYLVYSIIKRSYTKVVKIIPLRSKLTTPQGSKFVIELYKENCKCFLLLNR